MEFPRGLAVCSSAAVKRGCVVFFISPNLLAICIHSKLCVEKRGRVVECSVASLRDKRVKTLCGCREKRIQTKEKYKLRLTTKAYNLSYNYINYINNK
jgi:hypothetical protein